MPTMENSDQSPSSSIANIILFATKLLTSILSKFLHLFQQSNNPASNKYYFFQHSNNPVSTASYFQHSSNPPSHKFHHLKQLKTKCLQSLSSIPPTFLNSSQYSSNHLRATWSKQLKGTFLQPLSPISTKFLNFFQQYSSAYISPTSQSAIQQIPPSFTSFQQFNIDYS